MNISIQTAITIWDKSGATLDRNVRTVWSSVFTPERTYRGIFVQNSITHFRPERYQENREGRKREENEIWVRIVLLYLGPATTKTTQHSDTRKEGGTRKRRQDRDSVQLCTSRSLKSHRGDAIVSQRSTSFQNGKVSTILNDEVFLEERCYTTGSREGLPKTHSKCSTYTTSTVVEQKNGR